MGSEMCIRDRCHPPGIGRWSEVFGFASDPTEVLRHPLARSPIELREKLNQLGDENEDLKCKLESAKLKASLTEQVSVLMTATRTASHNESFFTSSASSRRRAARLWQSARALTEAKWIN